MFSWVNSDCLYAVNNNNKCIVVVFCNNNIPPSPVRLFSSAVAFTQFTQCSNKITLSEKHCPKFGLADNDKNIFEILYRTNECF